MVRKAKHNRGSGSEYRQPKQSCDLQHYVVHIKFVIILDVKSAINLKSSPMLVS